MVVARRPRRRLWAVPVALLVWSIVAAPQVAAIALVELYKRTAAGLPDVPDLDLLARTAPRTNLILAADGTVLAEIPFVVGKAAGHRFWARYEDIPERLVQAILAAEDVRFFSHGGVDLVAIVRAARANVRAGHTVEGASTLTQQLARALLPEEIGTERTFRRKAREAILARRMERRWSKEQILEAWANQVFLGSGSYGVAAAARAYFGKPLADLTVAECALIAGLAQAPGRADPTVDPAAARARRDEVLDRMLRAGFLAEAEHAAAIAEPLVLHPPAVAYGHVAAWATERARREVVAAMPIDWARGGVVVETSILPLVDAVAEDAVVSGAARVAGRHGTASPQGAAVLYDHATGYVEALVGGLDFQASKFDRTTQACRQPGSAFKPVVYGAALEHDAITPGTPLRDAPVSEWDDEQGVFWKPKSGHAYRGVALAQDALAASLNSPSIEVLDRIGPAAAIDLARRLGISTELAPVRPLVLGASCVIPWEMARAFGAFAERGALPAPSVVVRVFARDREELDRGSPWDPFASPARRLDRLAARLTASGTPALDAQTVYLLDSMMAEGVRSGTGHGARAIGRPAAGKTGTTNDSTDAWFIGFTGRVVAAVWVGHDDPAIKLGAGEDGAHAALPIWVDIVEAAEQGRRPLPVPGPAPPGIVRAVIDRETGLLAQPGAGGAVLLPFRAGTAPTETVGGSVQEVRDIDRLSHQF